MYGERRNLLGKFMYELYVNPKKLILWNYKKTFAELNQIYMYKHILQGTQTSYSNPIKTGVHPPSKLSKNIRGD